MKLRKDDVVQVMTGDNAGKRGRILSVDRVTQKVVVEGVNVRRKSVRRSQRNPQGGILSKEKAISAANVMLVCPGCGKPTRLGTLLNANGVKSRICKKCNTVVGTITSAQKINS